MNIVYSLYLQQHVSADVLGRRQVVLQIHEKKSILRRSLPFPDIKYDIFRSFVVIPNSGITLVIIKKRLKLNEMSYLISVKGKPLPTILLFL